MIGEGRREREGKRVGQCNGWMKEESDGGKGRERGKEGKNQRGVS